MGVQELQTLLKLRPFAEEAYSDLSLATLTAYSTYCLSQWNLPTSLENLAVINFKLFPSRFALVGWPQFPDVNRTNRSVLQMRPKYRNWATSITDKGVFLNEQGIAEAEALLGRLGPPQLPDAGEQLPQVAIPSTRGTARPRTIHPEDQVAEVRKSRLFKLYKLGQWAEAEAIDLINLLKVYDHTPSKEKQKRLRAFQLAAEQMGDKEIGAFLDAVDSAFRSYLRRQQ